jgi:NitT/TauT family transport system permease protein
MGQKKILRIGYLPITDHLVLGILDYFNKKRFVDCKIEPVIFNDWDDLKNALKAGKIDGSFILVPLAMRLRSQGSNIKLILLGNREGSVFIIDKNLKCKSIKDLKNKTLAIPHKYSFHALLLHQMLEKEGLDYKKDINLKEIPPPQMVNELKKGTIDGYFVAEPFGSEAEEEKVGKVLLLSKSAKKHHICCGLVMNETILKDHKPAMQEFTNSLVEAGNFMNDCPEKSSEIGSKFLHQSRLILKRVLSEKWRRVTAWDLFPVKEEFKEMQDYMIKNMKLLDKEIRIDDFINTKFAENAYKYVALKRKKKEMRKNLLKKTFFPLGVFILFIGIWQIISSLTGTIALLLPSPLEVLKGTLELLLDGSLLTHISRSLFRVFVGFLLASIIAIPLGLLLGTYWHLKIAFDPLLQILRPISPIAWIPLAILWFGIGDKPAIFIIFITSFFPILIASASSIKSIDPLIIKSAINFGVSNKDLLIKVILPASFPFIMVGLRISLGFAWVIIVAAEMVGMSSGLGFMILDARNYLRTDIIIAGMIIVGLIGLVLNKIMSYFENSIKRKWGHKEVLGEA